MRRIADYLLFDGRHSPQLTFTFIVEPGGALWLQVQGPAGEKTDLLNAYALVYQVGITIPDD